MKGICLIKHVLCAGGLLLAAGSAPALADDVGVSVSIGQPGFYGRITIGDYYPRPYLIYPEPVIIHRPWRGAYEPIYMHVPPGHARHWYKYCGHYGACGRPVYFVQERWYNDVYVPRYRESHGMRHHGRHDGHYGGDRRHGHDGHGHRGRDRD